MYLRLGLSCLESNNPRFCCLRTYSRERRLVYRTRPIVDTSRGYLRTAFEYSSSYHPLCLRLPLGRLFRTRTKAMFTDILTTVDYQCNDQYMEVQHVHLVYAIFSWTSVVPI